MVRGFSCRKKDPSWAANPVLLQGQRILFIESNFSSTFFPFFLFPVVKDFDFHCFLLHRRHLDRMDRSPGRASSASRRSHAGDRDRDRKRRRSEGAAPWQGSNEQQDAEILLQKVTEEAQRQAQEKIQEVKLQAERQKKDMQLQHQQKLEALEKEKMEELERMEKVQQEEREKMLKMQQEQKQEMEKMKHEEKERMAKELEKEQQRIDTENAEKEKQLQNVSWLIFQRFIFS